MCRPSGAGHVVRAPPSCPPPAVRPAVGAEKRCRRLSRGAHVFPFPFPPSPTPPPSLVPFRLRREGEPALPAPSRTSRPPRTQLAALEAEARRSGLSRGGGRPFSRPDAGVPCEERVGALGRRCVCTELAEVNEHERGGEAAAGRLSSWTLEPPPPNFLPFLTMYPSGGGHLSQDVASRFSFFSRQVILRTSDRDFPSHEHGGPGRARRKARAERWTRGPGVFPSRAASD